MNAAPSATPALPDRPTPAPTTVAPSPVTRFRSRQQITPTQQRLGVGVIVLDEFGRLLLEKRRDCGLWGLPGGRVEPGESVEAAAAREVFEESGLHVRITQLLGVYSDPNACRLVTYPGETHAIHIIDVILEARVESGQLTLSEESEQLCFFSQAELPLETAIAPPAAAPLFDYVHGRIHLIR